VIVEPGVESEVSPDRRPKLLQHPFLRRRHLGSRNDREEPQHRFTLADKKFGSMNVVN
jgi:hypothetical protein